MPPVCILYCDAISQLHKTNKFVGKFKMMLIQSANIIDILKVQRSTLVDFCFDILSNLFFELDIYKVLF